MDSSESREAASDSTPPQFLTQTKERMNKRMTSPSQNVPLFPEG